MNLSRRHAGAFVVLVFGILAGLYFVLPFPSNPPKRAFYYWKTEWAPSQEIVDSLSDNHIRQLYMRFFDVEWDDVERRPYPVAPLRFQSPPPANIEIIPVVYIVNAVFLKIPYSDVEKLADYVWTKVSSMASEEGLAFQQLQLDCDWSDSSRRNYFHFVELVGRKLQEQNRIVSATIRLHQIKYADRTGIPPVSRGMLMFYNFGRIRADSSTSSIFNADDASRYTRFISSYPLDLDIVLPVFSWSVHSRDGRVLGLLEKIGSDDLEAFDGFQIVSPNRYSAMRSFFFRGRYFMTGDLLLVEETTPQITNEAAALARRGVGWKKKYHTVALFDLDEKYSTNYGSAEIERILGQF
jgi:hypothetical protein